MEVDALVKVIAEGPVALITIDRPDVANALSAEVRSELFAILQGMEGNKVIRALVLTGSGCKVFAAGSDILDMQTMTAAQSVELSESIACLQDLMGRLPQPIVCAVNGWCLGGGLELALACDIRIASETARFGFPEAKLGIMPGGGGLARMVHLIGSAAARHLALAAEVFDARRAYELGLVSQLCAPDDLIAQALALGTRIGQLAPIALAQIKRTISAIENSGLQAGIQAELQACAVCFASHDKEEGMSAFLAKRSANFTAT